MTKRQHYISEGILWSFCGESKELFECLLMEKRVYGTTPSNAMCETYTYEHENIEKNRIENDFSSLENSIIPRIDSLIETIKVAEKEGGSVATIKEEVYRLLPSLLIFYYRSNALLTEYSMGDKTYKIPLMLEKVLNHRYIFSLASLIQKNYSFCIISTKSSFLISDQYISTAALKIKSRFVDISNRHMGLKDTLILVPLSKDYYVAFWHSSERKMFKSDCINQLDDNQTFSINRTIINNSYAKCVGGNKHILNMMMAEWSFQSPTQIFIGHSEKSSSGFIHKKEVFYYKNDREAFEIITNLVFIREYMEAKGNDDCPCRSGRLFKNCHLKLIKIARPIIEQFGKRGYIGNITIDGTANLELPIDSWGPMSRQYKI